MTPSRTLTGVVDIRGLVSLESQQEALRVELRRVLPLGWRIKPRPKFAFQPLTGKVEYTIEVEPMAARSRQ